MLLAYFMQSHFVIVQILICIVNLLSVQIKIKKEKRQMKAEKKIMQQRLKALQLAQMLGNVTKACRQRGISRTRFYEYKRRFQTWV